VQGGYLSVAIFFIMSGYVCSIKPLKLSRSGKADDAKKNAASSAFRRVFRIGAPAMVATTISWIVDRLGGFNISKGMPDYVWLRMFSAGDYTFSEAIRELFNCYVRIVTWLN
jgi:peptidoglycan/LPS O-acetylase OafA/YrhL